MAQKIKVILVQEIESDYSYFESYFKENGFSPQISVVSSAKQFCQLLERNSWDLIIANQGMDFSPEKVKLLLAERKIDIPFLHVNQENSEVQSSGLTAESKGLLGATPHSKFINGLGRQMKFKNLQTHNLEGFTSIEWDGIFQESPVPLWLEDFSEIKIFLDDLKSRGVEDFQSYFLENLSDLKICLKKLKIIDINKETLRLYQAERKEEILANPMAVFEQETFSSLIGELDAFARGERHYSCELKTRTLRGEPRYVLLKLSVMPGFERSFARVLVTTIDLTKRKKIEHELKIKDAAFSSSLTGIGIEDLDGKLTYINQSMAEMWGYSNPGEVVGTAGVQYWRDQRKAHAVFLEIIRKGYWRGELVGKKKDGSYFTVRVSATAIHDDRGNPVLVMGSFEDITEQKKAQIAIRESEAIFHALFARNQAVILLLDVDDPNLPIVDANNAAVEFYGYSRAQLLKMTMMDLNTLPPHETRQRIYEYREQNKKIFEFQHCLASGEIRDVETYSGQIDVHGRKLVYVAVHDVTERKLMEQELQQSEERYRALAENSPNAIMVHSNNKIVYVNQQALKILQAKDAHEIINSDILNFIHPNFHDAFRKRMDHLYQQKNVPLVEYQFVRKDGRVIDVEVADAYVYFQGQAASQTVFRDISNRKKAERVQQFMVRISRAILSAEKLSDLFEIIHHELGKVIDTTNFYIALYDKNTEMIVSPYYRDEKNNTFKLYISEKNLTSHVIKNEQPILVREDEIIRMIEKGELEDFSERPKVWLGVPLLARNKVVGAIVVQNYADENAFGKEEMEILKFISDHIDVSIERKQAEEQIRQSLHEKTVLLKEIHHRVKNNLQVISSLLYLQSKHVRDSEALKVFEESRHRVKSMSLVHEKLYQSQNLARIPFRNYIVDLTRYLFRSYNVDPFRIKLETDVADVALSVDIAIPCGLLINELVSNALIHAFPNQRDGIVRIELSQKSEKASYKLIVEDNGIGIRDYLKKPEKSSLGLQLVDTLIDQINGKMEMKTDEGTKYIIHFAEKNL